MVAIDESTAAGVSFALTEEQKELRRLAFVQLLQRLGVGLDTAAAVLDGPNEEWRAAVAEQMASFEELIARATSATDFLRHALDCPADHPVYVCPHMIETLDRMLSGLTFDELTAELSASAPDGARRSQS